MNSIRAVSNSLPHGPELSAAGGCGLLNERSSPIAKPRCSLEITAELIHNPAEMLLSLIS